MDNQNELMEKRAEENRKMTEEAYKLAAEQQERDRIAGIKPVLSSVADAIRTKLEREEFMVAVDEGGNPVSPRANESK